MRLAICLLTSLTVGGFSQALAQDPSPPVATPSAQTQQPAPSANQTTTPPAVTAPSAAPANPTTTSQPSTSGTAPAQSTAKTPELTPLEKNLLAHGFTMETHHGERVFCHIATETGTRFKEKTCASSSRLESNRDEYARFTREIERFQDTTRPKTSN
jgi:hypothetical protein